MVHEHTFSRDISRPVIFQSKWKNGPIPLVPSDLTVSRLNLSPEVMLALVYRQGINTERLQSPTPLAIERMIVGQEHWQQLFPEYCCGIPIDDIGTGSRKKL